MPLPSQYPGPSWSFAPLRGRAPTVTSELKFPRCYALGTIRAPLWNKHPANNYSHFNHVLDHDTHVPRVDNQPEVRVPAEAPVPTAAHRTRGLKVTPFGPRAKAPQASFAHRTSGGRATASRELPLIVHADDFGETIEITEGISRGIEAGVVTSTTIMANMPGTEHALGRAGELAERASFGVHLNFCEGRPLTTGSTLMDREGRLHRKRALFARAVSGRLSLRELEVEIHAQISRVHDAGVRISHVDGHKHLHQLPVVSTAVANVLPRFGISRVRITRLRSGHAATRASSLVREIISWHAAGVFRRAGLRSPVRTVDLTALQPGGPGVPHRSIPRVVDARGVVELCCHPGTPAADRGKPGSHRRADELDYLLSPTFRELLAAHGARLVTYWQV